MSIPGAASPLFLATTGAAEAFEISRSLRFNSVDSAHLSRTPSVEGNRKTWTWSGWVKRSELGGSGNVVFSAYSGSVNQDLYITFVNSSTSTGPTDGIALYSPSGGNNIAIASEGVLRDTSAWYHIVVACDTTQATAANRVKIYVNGSEVAYNQTTYPAQNADLNINNTQPHALGARPSGASSTCFNGYLAEINFIDAQALAPTDFGGYDTNNVWQAKDTSGLTFGTNGFRLKFADNSSDAALGTDSSGNSNTWTVNNLTVGGAINPTAKQNFDCRSNLTAQFTVNDLNFQPDLIIAKSTSNSEYWIWTDSVRGFGKALRSNTTDAENASGAVVTGVGSSGFSSDSNWFTTGRTYATWCWKAGGAAVSNTDGTITSSVSANTSYGFSIVTATASSAGDTIGHGLNAPLGLIIAKRTNATSHWPVYHSSVGANGFVYLNLTNGAGTGSDFWNNVTPTSSVFTVGSDVAVSGGSAVFYCWSEVAGFSKFSSYTGNGSGTGPVITGLGFRPKLVIIKESSSAGQSWQLHDDTRGGNKNLQANSSAAEFTFTSVEFNDDGFSINTSDNGWNRSGGTYIYAAFAATNLDQPGIDSLVDTPTNAAEPADTGVGGEVIGNHCTWNPLTTTTSMLFDGNLLSRFTSGQWKSALGTIGIFSGKWYWENQLRDAGLGHMYGIALPTAAADSHNTDIFGVYAHDGTTFASGAQGQSYTSGFSPGDIIGVALDLTPGGTSGTLTYYKNGVSLGVAFSALDCSKTYFPWVLENGNTSDGGTNTNFGQRGFVYTAPSNHKALNTANLPTPTIPDGRKYFDAKLWTGTGASHTITGYNFSPDMAWIKSRSNASNHGIWDIVRGPNKEVRPNTTEVERTDTDTFNSFNSDGFTLGTDYPGNGDVNFNGRTFIGWAWDAGTSTVTNNDGSIASQVRAQPSAGFSVVAYTGTGSTATWGHGLNSAPELVIVKSRSDAQNWAVYSKYASGAATPAEEYGFLNSASAFSSSGAGFFWNNTSPTNSVVTVGSDNTVNGSSKTYIAYCFSPVSQYSAIGSYTGNGSADGSFVFTGMKPAFLLLKNATGSANNWMLLDSTRGSINVIDELLFASSDSAENIASSRVDFLSNGFKIRDSSGGLNESSQTFVYLAFAENPFQANGGLAR